MFTITVDIEKRCGHKEFTSDCIHCSHELITVRHIQNLVKAENSLSYTKVKVRSVTESEVWDE